MKITFLGTNGWYDTSTGNTPSVFAETDGCNIILDAGFGFIKARELIKSDKPIALFISHFHLDHIIGLHTLGLFKFSRGIDIYTERGGEKILRAFLKMPFTTPPAFLPSRIRFHDLSKKNKLPFELEHARLHHPVPCYGFRIKADGKVLAYCTDTGFCANLKRLARSADLLITECAMSPSEKGPCLFHLTPQAAARAAKESGSGKLALFHFDPGKYPSLKDRAAAEATARNIFSIAIAASDGTEIIV